jgi:hypothetical protein
MDAPELILTLERRGLRLYPESGHLIVDPAHLLTDADRVAIRANKSELLTLLASTAGGSPIVREIANLPPTPPKPAALGPIRAAWTRSIAPDSRHPLIPPEVRAKIEAIEAKARALGWPAELLWNAGFWDCPRGLAALLDPEDEIAEVTSDHVVILKTSRDLLRFRRHAA